MTVTAELDQFRSLLRAVDPAALNDDDHIALLVMLLASTSHKAQGFV